MAHDLSFPGLLVTLHLLLMASYLNSCCWVLSSHPKNLSSPRVKRLAVVHLDFKMVGILWNNVLADLFEKGFLQPQLCCGKRTYSVLTHCHVNMFPGKNICWPKFEDVWGNCWWIIPWNMKQGQSRLSKSKENRLQIGNASLPRLSNTGKMNSTLQKWG